MNILSAARTFRFTIRGFRWKSKSAKQHLRFATKHAFWELIGVDDTDLNNSMRSGKSPMWHRFNR